MQYNLNEIWEMLDMHNHNASKEEQEIMSKLSNIENKLSADLNNDQKDLFSSLMSTISDLSYLERKEAFIHGVKFATQFLLDATDMMC